MTCPQSNIMDIWGATPSKKVTPEGDPEFNSADSGAESEVFNTPEDKGTLGSGVPATTSTELVKTSSESYMESSSEVVSRLLNFY